MKNALARRERLQRGACGFRDLLQHNRFTLQFQPARLNLGKIEHIVNHRQQSERRFADGFHEFHLMRQQTRAVQ